MLSSHKRGGHQLPGPSDAKVAEARPLERYFRILEVVSAFPDELGVTEIATFLALPKTSAHRLLNALVELGVLSTGAGRARSYLIGDRLTRLIHASGDDGWIASLCREPLRSLAERLGETCYIARLSGHRVSVVIAEAPDRGWTWYVRPGQEMLSHAAASAKAILAFQPDEIVRTAIGNSPEPVTTRTMTDSGELKGELAAVRRDGYATCIGELDESLAALAVPIRFKTGEVLYSLGVAGPLAKITDQDKTLRVEALVKTAHLLAGPLSTGSTILSRRSG